MVRKIPTAYRLKFNPRQTKAGSLHEALDEMLKKVGCGGCGRISIIDLHIQEQVIEREITGLESITPVISE